MNTNSTQIAENIILGSAQFGLNYGIKNSRGKIPKDEIFKILNYARSVGIKTLDTAINYGDAHNIIGEFNKRELKPFNIITKLSNYDPENVKDLIYKWLIILGIKQIDGILIHDLNLWNYDKTFLKKLQDEKQKGYISKIGFSLYYTEEIDELINKKIEFDLVQIPLNIFDQRFLTKLEILKKYKIEVHVRSVFLQGLLLMDIENIPAQFKSIIPKLDKLNHLAASHNKTVCQLALEFCMKTEGIDKLVLGVESLDNLIQNMSLLNKLNHENIDFSEYSVNDTNIIIPSNWGDDTTKKIK